MKKFLAHTHSPFVKHNIQRYQSYEYAQNNSHTVEIDRFMQPGYLDLRRVYTDGRAQLRIPIADRANIPGRANGATIQRHVMR